MNRMLVLIWPLPWTIVGLVIGIVCRIGGGRIVQYKGTVVCYGPWLSRLLRCVPIPGGASAVTLGHVILARSKEDMLITHSHELVHVRQYQRWGPLFIPAYVAAGLWLWFAGRDCYGENPFEIEAFHLDSTRTKLRT